uniref:ornithine carbamoyltransferase n=1 Tax=Euglena gracilis TaxID=3039 RepID=A0A142D9X7_EUGGR|nr:ornithine transcarbamylase 2 [Euglena gracilis]|eukprot:EG_transcript_11858
MPLVQVLKISSFSAEQAGEILEIAMDIKANPKKYRSSMEQKTLLMLFEKPSLRTRVSFETGMTQMGGHAIYYNISDSPLGKKETVSDTAKVVSRMVDAMIARVNDRKVVAELAANATIPIINALDDYAHPTQMFADMQTILEKKGRLKGLNVAYFGDVENNVTYDLMRAAALMGFNLNVSGPNEPEAEVLEEVAALSAKSGSTVKLVKDPKEAVKDVDVVYTDSWMSYGIPKEQLEARVNLFKPYQVTTELMALAKPDCIFMNCLPAARGMEQTAEVVDGPQSVVFDEAENRLHAHKAMLVWLLDAQPK